MPNIDSKELAKLRSKVAAHNDYLTALRVVRDIHFGYLQSGGTDPEYLRGYSRALRDIAYATQRAMEIRLDNEGSK